MGISDPCRNQDPFLQDAVHTNVSWIPFFLMLHCADPCLGGNAIGHFTPKIMGKKLLGANNVSAEKVILELSQSCPVPFPSLNFKRPL